MAIDHKFGEPKPTFVKTCDVAHNFKMAGSFYNKNGEKNKGYTTIFCTGCGGTMEILIVDEGTTINSCDSVLSLDGIDQRS